MTTEAKTPGRRPGRRAIAASEAGGLADRPPQALTAPTQEQLNNLAPNQRVIFPVQRLGDPPRVHGDIIGVTTTMTGHVDMSIMSLRQVVDTQTFLAVTPKDNNPPSLRSAEIQTTAEIHEEAVVRVPVSVACNTAIATLGLLLRVNLMSVADLNERLQEVGLGPAAEIEDAP